jgi:hypothetical protein
MLVVDDFGQRMVARGGGAIVNGDRPRLVAGARVRGREVDVTKST